MGKKGLTLVLSTVLTISSFSLTLLPRAQATPEPSISISKTAEPSTVPPGGTVTYTIILTNQGDMAAHDVAVTDALPAGFTYQPGSTTIKSNDTLIATDDPSVSGQGLTWDSLTVSAAKQESFYGIHTFVQDACYGSYIDYQLDKALELMGGGGHVKQLFYGITSATTGPEPCWKYFVNGAYDRNLVPVIRLQGIRTSPDWAKPQADGPGDYTSIAQAYKRVVQGLPRRDGHLLYIEVWNEPNLNIEWSGSPNPIEYGHFLVDVSDAIRSIGDPRIKVLNAGLAPGGNYNNLDFIDAMAAVPGAMEAFDLWATHPYPGNHPPEYNIHDGTATYKVLTIDSYKLELERLAAHGRTDVQVLATETGYGLGDNIYGFEGYPPIDESNRADYIKRAFRDYWSGWPEVVGVMPFELVDPHGTWWWLDWVYPTGEHHQQYDAVAALPKSPTFVPGTLTITFRATASAIGGTYYNGVSATSSNTAIPSLSGTAPVVVLSIATVTPTPTKTPTVINTSLGAGWNLIGLPVAVNHTASALLGEVNGQGGDCTEIDRWWGGGWSGHLRGLPFNDFPIELGQGYFLRCNSASTWTVTGTIVGQPIEVDLRSGWNLISIPYNTTANSASRLAAEIGAQGGSCTELDRWQSGTWRAHIVGLPFNDFPIEPGAGYFLRCNTASTFIPPLAGASSRGFVVSAQPNGSARGAASVPSPDSSEIRLLSSLSHVNLTVLDADHMAVRLSSPQAAWAAPGGTLLRSAMWWLQGSLRSSGVAPRGDRGARPRGLAFNPATKRLYVTNGDQDSVTVFGRRGRKVLATIAVGTEPDGVAVDPETNRIYVANRGSDDVSVINGATNEVIATIPSLSKPGGVAVDSGRVYVANTGGDSVTFIDGRTYGIIKTVPVGQAPYVVAVNPLTHRLYVGNGGSRNISVLDGHSGDLLATIELEGLGLPQGIAVNSEADQVYVVYSLSPGLHNIAIIDGESNSIVATIEGNEAHRLAGAYGIAVNPKLRRLYVTDHEGILVIDVDKRKVKTTLPHLGIGHSFGVVADPETGEVYVAGFRRQDVSPLRAE